MPTGSPRPVVCESYRSRTRGKTRGGAAWNGCAGLPTGPVKRPQANLSSLHGLLPPSLPAPTDNRVPDRQPPRLRLHIEEADVPPPPPTDALEALCAALEESTGCRFGVRQNDAEPVSNAATASSIIGPTCAVEALPDPAHPQASALTRLASEFNRVLVDLQAARHGLWQREAELAAGIPITQRPDEGPHLALRLEEVLRGGAEALDCDAAGAYLLDDGTSQLKLRAAWGLPIDRFTQPARPLRGALADLEALVGHAVVLDDLAQLPQWEAPEPGYRSALCVPISSPSHPLGTLWAFSRERRGFSDQQTQLWEIIAGRVAADLERQMLLEQGSAAREVRRQVERVGRWRDERLPQISPLLANWKVVGARLDHQNAAGADFFDWCITSDGRLALGVGDCRGVGVESMLGFSALHAALKAHASYRHSAAGLLERVNETLWAASPGAQLSAFNYVLVDPDTGALEYAGAGDGMLVALRPPRFRSLTCDGPLLGADPDSRYVSRRRRMAVGETLLMVSETIRDGRQRDGAAIDERSLVRAMRLKRREPLDVVLRRVREWLQSRCDLTAVHSCSLLLARRGG